MTDTSMTSQIRRHLAHGAPNLELDDEALAAILRVAKAHDDLARELQRENYALRKLLDGTPQGRENAALLHQVRRLRGLCDAYSQKRTLGVMQTMCGVPIDDAMDILDRENLRRLEL